MEHKPPQHKMGILAIGKNDFEGSVYQRQCPTCGVPAFWWCQTESGKRVGVPHAERGGASPLRAPEESGVDRTGLRVPRFGQK